VLIEFKYVGLAALGLSGAKVKRLSDEELKKLSKVKEKLAEARGKLEEGASICWGRKSRRCRAEH